MSTKDKLIAEGYTWSQTDTVVSFQFGVPTQTTQDSIEVKFTGNTLTAGLKDGVDYIKGKLYGSINATSSTWELKELNGRLLVQIQLSKDAKGSQWPVAITSGLQLRKDADPTSTFLLGQLTEGVLPHKTMELYLRSANAGHLPAQIKLGAMYELGKSQMVQGSDLSQALQWYHKAADQGSLEALMYCANAFYLGKGTDPDHDKALCLYEKMATQCQEELHLPCSKPGTPSITETTALTLLSESPLLSQVYVTACYQAGKILEAQKNFPKCLERYKVGACFNHAASIYQLGLLYQHGDGVAFDRVLASRYFCRAHLIDPLLIPPSGFSSIEDATPDPSPISPPLTPTPSLTSRDTSLVSEPTLNPPLPTKPSPTQAADPTEPCPPTTTSTPQGPPTTTDPNATLRWWISTGALVTVVVTVGYLTLRRNKA